MCALIGGADASNEILYCITGTKRKEGHELQTLKNTCQESILTEYTIPRKFPIWENTLYVGPIYKTKGSKLLSILVTSPNSWETTLFKHLRGNDVDTVLLSLGICTWIANEEKQSITDTKLTN
jgi:hypothetical protein